MSTGVEQTTVIIVGAGPSGLATAACLHQLSIPYTILEKEDCIASLFTKKSYDRLHLHLPKQLCHLPHLPFPASFPTYVPRPDLVQYFHDYASRFKINPKLGNFVRFAKYDDDEKIWTVEATVDDGGVWWYEGRFLVVATGETSEAFVPEIEGLSEFKGDVMHSTEYKSGNGYEKKTVLVVGSGNSGMEIALDLSNYGAITSIVVRSPIHILSRWILNVGLKLATIISVHWADKFMIWASKLVYGNLSKYGIERPKEGTFFLKAKYGKFPNIDLGTCKKIKSGEIQVLPALKSIQNGGNEVVFENGKCYQFDVIVFATGFKRSTHLWLQDSDRYLNKDGFAKQMHTNNWKGENGFYCAGLARRGLFGAGMDAQNIANHICNLISN